MSATEYFLSIPSRIISHVNDHFLSFMLRITNVKNSLDKQFEKNEHYANVSNEISKLEARIHDYDPYTLIMALILITFLFKLALKIIRGTCSFIYSTVKAIRRPGRNKEFEEGLKHLKETEYKFKKYDKHQLKFNNEGHKMDTILERFKKMTNLDEEKIKESSISGIVYNTNDSSLDYIIRESMKYYTYGNLLHPDVFVSARFIESQLVKIGIEIFRGKVGEAVGITTVSGTESITTAMLCYRNRANGLGITDPEMIIPETAHVAFDKASEMFNIKVIRIPVDPVTFKVNIKLVEKAITRRTMCIVGSFPNYCHGICDDIEQLSALAQRKNVPLHVDACLGGMLTAFYSGANIVFPKFDFTLEGVTSISADLYKHGLCPKGCSLLLYKNREYRKHQYFFYPHWMGGTYPSPTMAGSRTPVMIVASYAILIYRGKMSYVNQSKLIHTTVSDTKKKVAPICKEYNIKIIGDPQVCTIAFTGDNALHLYDAMVNQGWDLKPIAKPFGFHITVTMANIEEIKSDFHKDFVECCVSNLPKNGSKLPISALSESSRIFSMSANLPVETTREPLAELLEHIIDS